MTQPPIYAALLAAVHIQLQEPQQRTLITLFARGWQKLQAKTVLQLLRRSLSSIHRRSVVELSRSG